VPKLCDDCPLRGGADNELQEASFSEYFTAYTDILTGRLRPYEPHVAGVLIDEDRNQSLPLYLRSETGESFTHRIEDCERPEPSEERRLLLWKRPVAVCPALGHLAVDPGSRLYKAVQGNPPTPLDHKNQRILLGNTTDNTV
jgi:hypothetical protein